MLSQEHIDEIVKDLVSCYPHEGCGLVLGDKGGRVFVLPCANLIATRPQAASSPASGRTSYRIDPRHLLDAAKQGHDLLIVYHSHCDVGDYLSEEDRRMASIGGVEAAGPVWPDTLYLVVSVIEGRPDRGTLYGYQPTSRRFEAMQDGGLAFPDRL